MLCISHISVKSVKAVFIQSESHALQNLLMKLMINLCTSKPFHATGFFRYPLKTSVFLMFSGGIKRDQWHEVG